MKTFTCKHASLSISYSFVFRNSARSILSLSPERFRTRYEWYRASVNHRIYYACQWNSAATRYIDMLRTVRCACICARIRCAEAKHSAEHSPWHCYKNKRITKRCTPASSPQRSLFHLRYHWTDVTLPISPLPQITVDDLRSYHISTEANSLLVAKRNHRFNQRFNQRSDPARDRSWNLRDLETSDGLS